MHHKNTIKKSLADRILMWIVFVIFIIYSISLLYPFMWCLMNSFKDMNEFFGNINGWPIDFTLSNWVNSISISIDNNITIPKMYLNSIIITFGCTFFSIFSCSATGYIVSKFDFWGKKAIVTAALIIMMIPTMGSMAALYKLYNEIGLINTYFGIFITAMGGFGSGFILLYGYYQNLSWTYAEAAQLDGAGHFAIYFIIMLPMARPILSAVAILHGIGYWNDYFTIYMYAPEKANIAYGIQKISSQAGVDLPQVFAAMMMSIVPVLVVFAIFQKSIMNNTSIGGVKG